MCYIVGIDTNIIVSIAAGLKWSVVSWTNEHSEVVHMKGCGLSLIKPFRKKDECSYPLLIIVPLWPLV